jgi:hypothetical protein
MLKRRYLATLCQSSVHTVIVTARNAEAAETKATLLWEEDVDAFTFKDGHLDWCNVEVLDEEVRK